MEKFVYRDFEKLFQSLIACEWAEIEHELGAIWNSQCSAIHCMVENLSLLSCLV